MGTPVSYGPEKALRRFEDAERKERQEGTGDSERSFRPLFDEQQMIRLQQLQGQVPWIYGDQRGFGFNPPVARPLFLEKEEEIRAVVEVEKRKIEERLEEQREKERKDMAKLMKAMETVVGENQQLKDRLKKLEEREDGGLTFLTPESQKMKREETAREVEESLRERIMGTLKREEGRSVPEAPKAEERERGEKNEGKGEEKTAFQVMLKLMEGMQAMQKQWLEDREGAGGAEAVRGTPQLPSLADWSATTGPIDLNDWLALIEPMMSDLTNTSGLWWKQLMSEAMDWYLKHLQLQALDRINHEPKPSPELEKSKWSRLERRASTMLLMAIPEGQREELISSKRLTALKILCHLLTVYQPGGLAEKELILRQLESPPEATSLGDAVQALRRWQRWRRRAGELGVLEPDPFILLKGLNKIIKRPLEGNRDLNFRVSLARSTLQVDATPTSKSVTSFALHLLAEFEQIAHQDGGPKKKSEAEKAKELRLKKFEDEGPKGGGKGKDKGGENEREPIKCRFFLSETGCRKGKDCSFSHDQKDEKRRCWGCGATDHFSNVCPRGKGRSQFEGSPPKQKSAKAEVEEDLAKNKEAGRVREAEEEDKESTASMKDLLEEANKMLKTLTGPTSSSTTRTERTEAEERNQVMERLQEQLNSLKQNNLKQKTFKLSRMAKGREQGLIDSGATNPLRPKRLGEREEDYDRVFVTLADGGHIQLKMTPGGVMITEKEDVEPIVPMGHLVKTLKCSVSWEEGSLKVLHPVRGRLPVKCCEGCPQVPRDLALDLIEEIEKMKSGASLRSLDLKGEVEWMKELVETHPVLKTLPQRIKDGLVVEPGDWNKLPGNRRQRKKLKKEGVVIHLFAGGEEGFTLSRSLKQQGGDPLKLVEIDIKRGSEQDVLSPGGVYNSMVRIALEGKLKGMLGGPNCRSRSVLRHYPIPGVDRCPRPVRSWGGGEHGIGDLTEDEDKMIYEDDLMLWRMIFLYMISTYVRRARGEKGRTWFSMEQPASPSSYQPEVVSLWDTKEWCDIKKEFDLVETTFNQGDLGGDAVKPTTFGGNLELKVEEHERKRRGKLKDVKDSKELARWAPGVMNMVAQALMEQLFEKEVKIKALSWEEHLALNHVPYRKDCLICQETQQKGHPHRKVQHVSGGVLSLDTSGPLVAANDAGGFKAKYMLVGVLTWAVPKGSRGLEEVNEEGSLEGAPEIEAREGQPEEKKEGDEALGGLELEEVREEGDEKEKEGQEEGQNKEDEKPEFEVRKFRMASPMITKRAEEVTKVVMEFILKLRMDGYYVNRIHTDLGHEFMGYFKKWTQQRGIALTRTPGDDPQSNGRAEVAIQSLKSQVRRTLRSAEVGSEWWPWALRYVNEMNRAYRTDRKPDWPNFLQEVLVKKRTWRQGELDTTVDRVKYLAPAPEEHGHWIVKDRETPRVTKYIMKKALEPVTEGTWLALERELTDAISVRRRLRGKTAVRRMEVEGGREEEVKKSKVRSLRITEEEVSHMISDEPEAVVEETKILQKLKQEAEEEGEDEEILQTRVVSTSEVVKNWEDWLGAIGEEVKSLLMEKEAFKELKKDEVEEVRRRVEAEGRSLEILPSKVVFTVKPGVNGGKKKVRWVVCGNYEMKKEQEDTYSGGADATAFRVMLVAAAREGWDGASIDVKTAFLNAEMSFQEGEAELLVRPPAVMVEKGYLLKDVLYQPLKAVYGFRRSPRLWSLCRDEKLQEMRIEEDKPEGGKVYRLFQLQSEPNLWKIVEQDEIKKEEMTASGLLMTYVDDLFIVGSESLVSSTLEAVKKVWKTSSPEWVSEKAIKFLGMDVKKERKGEGKAEWMITQESYLKDLLSKEGQDEIKRKRIPITRDQAAMLPEKGVKVTAEDIKKSQKVVGELLWIVTRSRPDVMFSVSRMGANITKNPQKVIEASEQTKGYLKGREEEGICFKRNYEDDEVLLECYSDSSFAPEGEESHGCFIILLDGIPIFWRSGRQGMVTLSTAETELMEMVEGMVAGEAVVVIAQEVFKKVRKVLWSDSQSAISILTTEGGNWRTRHLKMRSSYARQAVLRGEWNVGHKSGEIMIADLGTKPLSSTRLEKLKNLMNMKGYEGRRDEEEKKDEVTEAERKRKDEDTEAEKEEREGSEVKINIENAAKAVRLITLAAAISIAKGEEDEVEEKESDGEFHKFMLIYTVVVVATSFLIPVTWKVGVRILRSCMCQTRYLLRFRSLPDEPEEEPAEPVEEVQEVGGVEEFESQQEEAPEGREDENQGVNLQPGVPEGHREEEERRPQEEEERMRTPTPFSYEREWEEIMREEELIRREVQQGLPHVMGNPEPEGEEPRVLEDLPFRVYKTRHGKVYHTNRDCKHLVSRNTRGYEEAKWCMGCRLDAWDRGVIPTRGVRLYIGAMGSEAHTNERCPRRNEAVGFSWCLDCIG